MDTATTPTPRDVDASLAFLGGRWKRRDGTIAGLPLTRLSPGDQRPHDEMDKRE
jgi:hypothetical protein